MSSADRGNAESLAVLGLSCLKRSKEGSLCDWGRGAEGRWRRTSQISPNNEEVNGIPDNGRTRTEIWDCEGGWLIQELQVVSGFWLDCTVESRLEGETML